MLASRKLPAPAKPAPPTPPFNFQVPDALLHPLPTERRGIRRDEVRLLVSRRGSEVVAHHQFFQLDELLRAGDVLVINESATVAGAFPVVLPRGGGVGRLHLAPSPQRGDYLVELRRVADGKSLRFADARSGDVVILPGSTASFELRAPLGNGPIWSARYYATATAPTPLTTAPLPVQYDNLKASYPLAYYQTLFGRIPGSVEMPSAGRAFTPDLMDRLEQKGVTLVRVVLHTGLSSPEQGEGPLPEYFRVEEAAVAALNEALGRGRRIIGVGTTAIRATESAVGQNERLRAGAGWTNLHLSKATPLRVCNGLLTGFHEPRASHLDLLSALVEPKELDAWYRAAIAADYYWHEFGDLHLVLP